jgi:hypothetical protein
MFKSLKRAAIVAALAVGAMTVGITAEARDRYRDRGDDAAIAIGAGIIGLAIGAAIASDNDRDYYDRGYYYGRPRYYYRSYPRRYYYYDHYPRRDYRHYRHDRRWDRGWDRGRYRGW